MLSKKYPVKLLFVFWFLNMKALLLKSIFLAAGVTILAGAGYCVYTQKKKDEDSDEEESDCSSGFYEFDNIEEEHYQEDISDEEFLAMLDAYFFHVYNYDDNESGFCDESSENEDNGFP